MRLHLYRLGSDPEWVFTQEREWEAIVVPASSVISSDKVAATRSFIGTDNHPATAEMRPTPSHNIKRQLLDIAEGLVAVSTYLKSHDRWHNLKIMAWPYVAAEPLGGHIHASFFVNDPLLQWAREHNISYTTQLQSLDKYAPMILPATMQERDHLEKFAESASNWQSPTPWVYGKVMNYLLHPFEAWVQPWGARCSRNTTYGKDMTDLVRHGVSNKPMIPKYLPFAYCHYEYRLPSTWLQHPYLAYVYYALAKLTILNFDEVATVAKTTPNVKDSDSAPKNDKFKELFHKRLSRLRGKKLRITNDIKDLDVALEAVDQYRKEWFDPTRGVNVDYWRELL